MKKKLILIKEAKEVWAKFKNNDFILLMFPTFDDYWKECQRINNLPEKDWQELVKQCEHQFTKSKKVKK